MEKKRIETEWSCHAKSRQPNRAKNPENDRQNVAFYKKREGEILEGNKYPDHENVRGLTSTPRTENEAQVSNSFVGMDKKTWAKVVSTPLKQEKSTVFPKYLAEEPGFDKSRGNTNKIQQERL